MTGWVEGATPRATFEQSVVLFARRSGNTLVTDVLRFLALSPDRFGLYKALEIVRFDLNKAAGMGSLYRSGHELVLVFKHGRKGHRNNTSSLANLAATAAMSGTIQGPIPSPAAARRAICWLCTQRWSRSRWSPMRSSIARPAATSCSTHRALICSMTFSSAAKAGQNRKPWRARSAEAPVMPRAAAALAAARRGEVVQPKPAENQLPDLATDRQGPLGLRPRAKYALTGVGIR